MAGLTQMKALDDRHGSERSRMLRDHQEVLQRVTQREFLHVQRQLQVHIIISS